MIFVIDNLKPNRRALKTLEEVDALVRYKGVKPKTVALFPKQFEYVKRSCLLEFKRRTRRELKQINEGRRLKSGALQSALEDLGMKEKQEAQRLSYKGIVLYDQHSGIKV